MGLLQAQPDAPIPAQLSSAASSVADDAAWLDGLLGPGGAPAGTQAEHEQTRLRLANLPFDRVLAAIERAGAGRDAAAEIALYRGWVEANPTSLLLGVAWFNMGVVLGRTGDSDNAAIAYRNALLLRPELYAASINLGLLLEANGRPDEALAVWGSAIQPDAVRVSLGIQQGRLLERLGRFAEAETALRQVLLTDPAQPDVIHHWVHLRQKACLWPVTPDTVPGLPPAQLLRHSGPLGILALSDDIQLQRDAAAAWVTRKTEPAPRRLAPAKPYGHTRIRLGYMSSDFCSHAMSYLITELFERHDRRRFEIFGYCASKDDGTQLRQRVVAAFDHHRIIRTMSDAEAAQAIRDDEIDVLVDLNGLTDGSRLTVLRWKPAPIQATYLGFIGPLPLPELDYLFCDTMVVPPEYESAYAPQPLPIARLYQVNDSKRTIGRSLSRAELGLPKDRFVLCCFSRHYKITEPVFAAWMSILRQAANAVLWLAADNPYSESNLRAAAARAGIAADRLIISERADPDLYLSRLAVADLFLDTFPYNAGTVASDAIRMGLPILTLCGAAFASRMAASLLRMIGATAGITTSLTRYVEAAVRLASEPAAYASYKGLFTTAAWQSTIGDITGFTAEYEATIIRIVAAADAAAARALEPRNADVPINARAALPERPDWDEAVALTQQAIALRANSAIAWTNLAVAFIRLGQHEAARSACHEAMTHAPQGAAIAATLGGVLLELGEAAEAASLCRQAIALDAGMPNAQFNLSHACKALNELEAAQEAAEAAIALSPGSAAYHFHLAHILLLRGEMARGWEEYEWRWHLPDFGDGAAVRRAFAQPEWAGEDISDKTILIYTEQGLGDIIQFARYLPLVARRAGRVIVAANPATRRLLSSMSDIALIGVGDIVTHAFDVHCPLLSLPRVFGTRLESIPASVPYLFAEAATKVRWATRIGGQGLRVGIVWAGNPATKRDRFRSPRLVSVAPLFDIPGITFVVLQMGPGRADCIANPLPPHVVDLGDAIGDLADTAAIMAGLDLMISSCTAPLHLAGALGVRSWAMIPSAPHFPWLLERSDTPWYPSMRLYRQTEPGLDWSSVISRMAADLVFLRDRYPRNPCADIAGDEASADQAAAAWSVNAG